MRYFVAVIICIIAARAAHATPHSERAARDARLHAMFVQCRDAKGGAAQRACEAEYARFVAANYSVRR
jgi:hypothetical protein